MEIFLMIVLAFVSLIMGMAILLQEPKQAGLSGSFGMGGDQMLGAGTPNPLSKLTGWLAAVFLALCLVIGLVQKSSAEKSSIPMQAGDTSGLAPAISNPDATQPGELPVNPDAGADGLTDGPTDGNTGSEDPAPSDAGTTPPADGGTTGTGEG